MNGPTLREVAEKMVDPGPLFSPLDVLRVHQLSVEHLTQLAIVCEYLNRRDLADLALAEAEMWTMLAERGPECLTLN